MASPAGAAAWPVRFPVADFGALCGGGVFDEIDISGLCRWLKGECQFVLRLPDPLTSGLALRQLQIRVLLHDAATTPMTSWDCSAPTLTPKDLSRTLTSESRVVRTSSHHAPLTLHIAPSNSAVTSVSI